MQDQSSIGVNQGFKEIKLPSQDSGIITERKVPPFREFTRKIEELLVALLLYAILLSAVLQSLYRDEVLAWLRDILERTYLVN